MIKPSIGLQDLRRKIYLKAKSDKTWRFWGLYVHVCNKMNRLPACTERHLMHAKKRRGFGWNRWSSAWLYNTLGLFNDYKIRYYQA